MKDEQFHKDFIRSNLPLLTSPQFDREKYKRAYRKFYVEQNHRISKPSARELMELLVAHLRVSMSPAQIVNLIDTLPFFRETGEREIEKLRAHVSSGNAQSVLSAEQIETVKKVGAYEAVRAHHIDEVRKQSEQVVAEFNEQIAAKKREFEALPSVLDEGGIEEPEFNPEIEDRKTWWERFYLQSDPFPRKDGLSAISTDLYEEIIIKTEPFQRILSLLKSNPDALFHTGSLLVGDYGYGKTTFIDYLSHYLINQNILPLRITSAKGYADASGFSDTFLNKLRTELRDEVQKVLHRAPDELCDHEVEDQIVEMSKQLSKRKLGIVIFMDDFHKFRSHFRQIFEFLGTLQVLKDNLTREGAKVGFVVSGVPSWLDELKANSQLVGFLDAAPIRLPEVSAELVSNVFNRRIAAFCYESTPRKIKPDFVRNLVRDLGGEQGIRGCINRIVDELSNNNLAIVDSPLEVSENTLNEVKKMLEGSPDVKASLNKLLFEVRFRGYNNQQIAKCLELLVHIFVQNGIAEADRQFTEGSFYFQVLRDVGLIQKQKGREGKPFRWNLSESFSNIVRQIHRKQKLNPADYLLKLYAYKGYVNQVADATSGSAEEIIEVKRLFAEKASKIESPARDAIAEGLERLERLLLRPAGGAPTERDVKTAVEAFDSLTTAIGYLDGSEAIFSNLGISVTSDRWDLKPGAPEIVHEAFRRLDDHERERSLKSRSHALKTAVDALLEIAHSLEFMGEQLLVDSEPLLHRPASHTEEELVLFDAIREGFFSGVREEHFDYMRALVDYLELRFRSYFYFSGNLVFGDDYFDQCPQALQQYSHKNVSARKSFTTVQNLFDGLTRSQYRSIFTESNRLRDHCVTPLKVPWQSSDWDLFTGIYATENIKVAHLQIDAFSAQDKRSYRKFASLAEEITAAMCEIVSNVVARNFYLIRPEGAQQEAIDIAFCFKAVSTAATTDADGKSILKGRMFSERPTKAPFNAPTFQRSVKREDAERIVNGLKAKIDTAPFHIVTQDLLDLEYIQTHYRASIGDFIGALGWAAHFTKALRVEPWFGSSIAISLPR